MILLAEVAAAALLAHERVTAHEFAEFDEVSNASGALERLVPVVGLAEDVDFLPISLAQVADGFDALLEARRVAGHAAVLPHELAEFLVETVGRALALVAEHALREGLDVLLGFLERAVVGRGALAGILPREVAGNGRGQNEIAVAQSLHQRARAKPVRAVVGEVRLAQHEQAGDVAHQVVVHPQAAHRVMDRRVDAHRRLVGVLVRDLLIHREEVAVTLADLALPEALDGGGEVEIDAKPGFTHATAFVANGLGGAAGDVARREVAERGIHPLKIVIAVAFRDVRRLLAAVFLALGHPHATVIAERLGHQGELRLIVTADRDARRMDLRVAGVAEARAALVGAPARRDVRTARVGREVIDVAVAAGREHHGVAVVPGDCTRLEVADDDALGVAVHDHEVEHLGVRVGLHTAVGNVAVQGRVSTEEQLLASLAAGVEGARNLRATEGAVVEEATVFAGEGYALRGTLVNDVDRHLGEPMHVRLTSTEVTALDGVVEEAMHRVAVVLVVLGRVDAALGRDRVRAPGRVVEDEVVHLVAQLREGGGGGGASEARTDDEDLVFPLVRRVDELRVELVMLPLFSQRAGGDVGIQRSHVTWPPFPAPRRAQAIQQQPSGRISFAPRSRCPPRAGRWPPE